MHRDLETMLMQVAEARIVPETIKDSTRATVTMREVTVSNPLLQTIRSRGNVADLGKITTLIPFHTTEVTEVEAKRQASEVALAAMGEGRTPGGVVLKETQTSQRLMHSLLMGLTTALLSKDRKVV